MKTFLFGLLPLDTIFNVLYEPLKVVFNIDPEDTAELDKARADSQKFMEEYNLKNDTNLTVSEYNDSQKMDKQKLSIKLKKLVEKLGIK